MRIARRPLTCQERMRASAPAEAQVDWKCPRFLEPLQEPDDLARNPNVAAPPVTDDVVVLHVLRPQHDAPILSGVILGRRLAVQERDDDVAVEDAGALHAVTAHSEGEALLAASEHLVDSNHPVGVLNGEDRPAGPSSQESSPSIRSSPRSNGSWPTERRAPSRGPAPCLFSRFVRWSESA